MVAVGEYTWLPLLAHGCTIAVKKQEPEHPKLGKRVNW